MLVYSCNFGNYDKPKALDTKAYGVNYVYITDGKAPDGWNIIMSNHTQVEKTPRRAARRYKTKPLLISEGITVWIDSSFEVCIDSEQQILDCLGDYDIAAYRHPAYDCSYKEADVCIEMGLSNAWVVSDQMDRYRDDGLVENWGLWSTGFIIRKDTPEVRNFNKLWFEEIKNGSVRDQLSFPYSLWKTGLKIKTIPGNIYESVYVKKFKHNNENRLYWGV